VGAPVVAGVNAPPVPEPAEHDLELAEPVGTAASIADRVLRRHLPGSSNPTSLLFNDKFRTNVYAVSGSADYSVSDALRISPALRYDVEERSVLNIVPSFIPEKNATFHRLESKGQH